MLRINEYLINKQTKERKSLEEGDIVLLAKEMGNNAYSILVTRISKIYNMNHSMGKGQPFIVVEKPISHDYDEFDFLEQDKQSNQIQPIAICTIAKPKTYMFKKDDALKLIDNYARGGGAWFYEKRLIAIPNGYNSRQEYLNDIKKELEENDTFKRIFN